MRETNSFMFNGTPDPGTLFPRNGGCWVAGGNKLVLAVNGKGLLFPALIIPDGTVLTGDGGVCFGKYSLIFFTPLSPIGVTGVDELSIGELLPKLVFFLRRFLSVGVLKR